MHVDVKNSDIPFFTTMLKKPFSYIQLKRIYSIAFLPRQQHTIVVIVPTFELERMENEIKQNVNSNVS